VLSPNGAQHGKDGLSNISETHPHFTPAELADDELHEHLDISKKSASEVMLDILEKEEKGSVVIVALGPRECGRALVAVSRTLGLMAAAVYVHPDSEQPSPRITSGPKDVLSGRRGRVDGWSVGCPRKHITNRRIQLFRRSRTSKTRQPSC
jgi:hypothetical protein